MYNRKFYTVQYIHRFKFITNHEKYGGFLSHGSTLNHPKFSHFGINGHDDL